MPRKLRPETADIFDALRRCFEGKPSERAQALRELEMALRALDRRIAILEGRSATTAKDLPSEEADAEAGP